MSTSANYFSSKREDVREISRYSLQPQAQQVDTNLVVSELARKVENLERITR